MVGEKMSKVAVAVRPGILVGRSPVSVIDGLDKADRSRSSCRRRTEVSEPSAIEKDVEERLHRAVGSRVEKTGPRLWGKNTAATAGWQVHSSSHTAMAI